MKHAPNPSGRENPATGRRICAVCHRDLILISPGNSVMGAVWRHV